MPSAVNGYSLNIPNESANWSPREFNLLSAFAGLMPTSGTRIIDSVSKHSHTFLTDTNSNYKLSATSTGIEVTGNISASLDVSAGGDIFTTKWTSYIPEMFQGWVSASTSAFYYKQLGDLVFVKFGIEGSASNLDANYFSLPFSADGNWVFPQMFQGYGTDPITGCTRLTSANPTIFEINPGVKCLRISDSKWGVGSPKKWFCGQIWYRKAS